MMIVGFVCQMLSSHLSINLTSSCCDSGSIFPLFRLLSIVDSVRMNKKCDCIWTVRLQAQQDRKVEMEIESATKYWHKQSLCLLYEITNSSVANESWEKERSKNVVVGIGIGWKLNAICTLSRWCFDLASVSITNTNAFALIFARNISVEISYFMRHVKWHVSWKASHQKEKKILITV